MDAIKSYHAHIYYEAPTRPDAEKLRAQMEALFPQAIYGRWHDVPVGPHPSAMFQIAFAPDLFPSLVPWLIVNRGPLTIFLHPETGFPRDDHSKHAVWMGRQQEIKLDVCRSGADPSSDLRYAEATFSRKGRRIREHRFRGFNMYREPPFSPCGRRWPAEGGSDEG